MRHHLILAVASTAALALAAAAQAQEPGHPQMMHGPPSAEMKARHEAMMKQHVEDLKTILRLRPDQEPALAAFVAARHRDGGPEMRDKSEAARRTTPERLDEMARRDAARTAQREQRRQALAKFYAVLSPDQQKVFDALQRLSGPHGARRMMGARGEGGPGPDHGPH